MSFLACISRRVTLQWMRASRSGSNRTTSNPSMLGRSRMDSSLKQRQLADASVNFALTRSYGPFGDPLVTTGAGWSIYGFTGEQRDATGLVYLRARYYGPQWGRFLSRDVWEGDPNQPMSYDAWLYVYANPANRTDPAGLCARGDAACRDVALGLYKRFNWRIAWSGDPDAWTVDELRAIQDAAEAITRWLNAHGGNGEARVRAEFGPATFHHAGTVWTLLEKHHVRADDLYMLRGFDAVDVIHEMGHILDNLHSPHLLGSIFGGGASDDMVRAMGIDPTMCTFRFECSLGYRMGDNYRIRARNSYEDISRAAVRRDPHVEEPPFGSYGGNYARIHGPSEDFAATFEMIVAGTLGSQAPRRAAWFSDYARSLTRLAPKPEGDPYTCPILHIALPVPTPP